MQAIERIRAALRNIDSAIHEGAREDAYFELVDACNPAAMTEVLAHIDALTAENERLRKDAERLEWLAENPVEAHDVFGHFDDPAAVRRVIDAAMKGEKP